MPRDLRGKLVFRHCPTPLTISPAGRNGMARARFHAKKSALTPFRPVCLCRYRDLCHRTSFCTASSRASAISARNDHEREINRARCHNLRHDDRRVARGPGDLPDRPQPAVCLGKDLFVHASALNRGGLADLAEGQRVAVDMIEGGKGPEAVSIRLI